MFSIFFKPWKTKTLMGSLVLLAGTFALAQDEMAEINQRADGIEFNILLDEYEAFTLEISDSQFVNIEQNYNGSQTPRISTNDRQIARLADGTYTWELTGMPFIPSWAQEELVAARETGDQLAIHEVLVGLGVADLPVYMSGGFSMQNGIITLITNGSGDDDSDEGRAQIFATDLVVQGSGCIGVDCANGETFGFDTLRLKENNLRIHFQDTSNSGSFPSADWRILANDTTNGGGNYLAIEDSDNGTKPFRVDKGAGNNAIYVESGGNVGLGNSNPVVDLHITSGDSPSIRLEQDSSSGFTAQTWDISGNETNFFVRDATNGSALPFRIRPGSGTNNALYIDTDGDIGFGTASPDGLMDLAHPTNANNHAFLVDASGNFGVNIDNGQTINALFEIQATGGVSKFAVESDGKVGIGTNVPDTQLHLQNTGNVLFRLQDIGSGILGQIDTSSGTFNIRTGSSHKLRFGTVWESNDLVIGTDHKVGIGVATPLYELHLASGARVDGGVWTDASSRSLKKDIRDLSLTDAVSTLEALSPVRFYYKEHTSGDEHLGFIAEDVPDLVATTERNALAPMDIVAVLTKVVQHQQSLISTLSTKISDLEQKLKPTD